MNVREDLLSDMVTTLYKDEARIKQLEAALADTPEITDQIRSNEVADWYQWRAKYAHLIDALKAKE